MTRAERAAEVARLRDEQGLHPAEIAQRLGIGRSYAYELLNDPIGEKARARKHSYRGTCVTCGNPTHGGDGPSLAPEECESCWRGRNAERNARILAAWERGEPAPVIAKREDVTAEAVAGVIRDRRKHGQPVPLHRRRNRELWPLIQRRWAAGASIKQIADECETSEAGIGNMMQFMRRAGVDLPYRLPPRAHERTAA